MNRAINIINMIKDEFIPSEFDELVNGYFDIEYVKTIEGELIVYPSFMKLLKIIGYGYYEDASLYIKRGFNMTKVSKNIPDNQARVVLATKYDMDISTIEITNLLLFFINTYCDRHKNIEPYQLISRVGDNNIIRTKKSFKTKLLYYLRLSAIKDELVINQSNVVILSLLSKKSVSEITDKIVKEYIKGDV